MPKTIEGVAKFGKNVSRKYRVTEGLKYVISPLNPRKLRHRGRLCTVQSILSSEKAMVMYIDSEKHGIALLSEMVQVEKKESESLAEAEAKAMARAHIIGPQADHPQVEVLLDKWWKSHYNGTNTPDHPDYLQEALAFAKDLVYAGDLVVAKGEMDLIAESARAAVVELIVEAVRDRGTRSIEDVVVNMHEVIRPIIEDAQQKIEIVKEKTLGP